MLLNLVGRFKSSGVTLVFSGIKKQVADVMDRTGLTQAIGQENIFPTDQEALDVLWQRLPPSPSPSGAAAQPPLLHAA